jgi:alkanesulfonate monooxygenase SsuD/methylene tetrahydromethanopterin reductase-like flavin-dependent oxidoreductase (luciferase family)
MMEFGISLLPDCDPEERSAHGYYKDMLAISQLADEIGFRYVKMTEHYLNPYGGYCPDPLGFLSAVAAVTKNIRLMTGGIQASFHHPVQIAAQAAQLDTISNGRLDVGFARAFLPYEFDAFGIDMESSKERFRETIRAVIGLWTETNVSEDTQFFRYSDVTSIPSPVQRPHPPVWAAAVLTKSSFEWIGDSGYGLLVSASPTRENAADGRQLIDLYRERFRAAPQNAGKHSIVAISVPLLLAESDHEARDLGARLQRQHWKAFANAADSWRARQSSAYAGYQDALTRIVDRFGDDSTAEREWSVFGSPESAIEQIREMRAALSPDVILWQVDTGGQEFRFMERTLKLFASQVLPHL